MTLSLFSYKIWIYRTFVIDVIGHAYGVRPSADTAVPTMYLKTHCGLVMPYGDRVLCQLGSGNGLLPDGTKPLPEPMLTHYQWDSVTYRHQPLNLTSTVCKIPMKSPRGQWVSWDIPSNLWYQPHLCGQKIVDRTDVVGALPFGAAPVTPSFLN